MVTAHANQDKNSEICSDAKAVLSWSETNAYVIDRTPCISKENAWIELIISALGDILSLML